jgi:tetratricopeptide (TPR) repeat protein
MRSTIASLAAAWRNIARPVGIGVAVVACSVVVAAQTPGPSPDKSEPKRFEKAPKKRPPADDKKAEGDEADPAKKAARPLLSRIPETQEEKDRLLQDLYALLATAEDENAAAPITQAIERVWNISGSDTVNLLLDRAVKAHATKNDALSYKLFEHLTALAPDHTEVWTRRAFVYYQNNDVDRAVADLRRVIALDPNHFKALDGLVTVWREIGFKRGALAVARQLLMVHPFASGAKQATDELEREVEGQGL